MDQEYYRKIPVSTPPEKEGYYNTDLGKVKWNNIYGWHNNYGSILGSSTEKEFPTYYLLPIPSEELALINPTEYRRGFVEGEQSQMRKSLLFAEFIKEKGYTKDHHTANCEVVKWRLGYFSYTTSELYNSEEFQQYLKEKGIQK
jgi:hypothetical protein